MKLDSVQSTVPTADVIRQAREQRRHEFEALAAYANLGDTPRSWQEFRLSWPDFFPHSPSEIDRPGYRSLADWFYASADDWMRFCTENSTGLPADYKSRVIPPLLWYRDLLRVVWARKDPRSAALCALLGFEDQAKRSGVGQIVTAAVRHPLLIPGQSLLTVDQTTKGLSPGQPMVDEITHTIRWEFGCQFQRGVYDLMQEFWRAKVCPQCERYFIAGKSAQKFCSSRCFGNKKTNASLEFYHRKGKFIRERRRNLPKRSVKKRGK